MKEWLRAISAGIAVLVAVGTAVGSVAINMHQIRSHELRVTALEQREVGNRELLVRIEERLIAVQREVRGGHAGR
jgi:precorrin-6B methylase 2